MHMYLDCCLIATALQYARQVTRCLRILQTYTEGVDKRLRQQGYTGLRSHAQAKQQQLIISPAATPTSAATTAAATAANTAANSTTGKIKRVIKPVSVPATAAADTDAPPRLVCVHYFIGS
jgi:hypothetical protein